MYPKVDKDALDALYNQTEEDYERNKDWRAICDRYMQMRKDGSKNAGPDIAEASWIERSVGEEYMAWQDEGDELSAGDESAAMMRSLLERENYDPDAIRFEELPYYLNRQTPDRGSVPEMESHQREAWAAHDEALESLYADMYERSDVLPFAVKVSVPGYEDYAKKRTQERIAAITAEHTGRSPREFAPSAGFGGFGVDYSKSSMEKTTEKGIEAAVDKALGVEEPKKPEKTSPRLSRQLNSVEHGVSNPDYDFDEFDDDEDDDSGFGR